MGDKRELPNLEHKLLIYDSPCIFSFPFKAFLPAGTAWLLV
jgi:hypothetical protein